MAVKKHELIHENQKWLDLNVLTQYIKLMGEVPNYTPPPIEIIKHSQDIVKCLAHKTNDEHVWSLIHTVEEFFIRTMNVISDELRHEMISVVLEKFYSIISDPQSGASPVTSIVLVVLDGSDGEAKLAVARWLVQKNDNGPAGMGLRAALSCLYRWMYEWHGTPGLGDWVMVFIKALEETERYDILIEVSVDNLGNMFLGLENLAALRTSVADVTFHVLASLRDSTEALNKISTHLGRVLVNLAADSGQWSRQILQDIVDISSAMVDSLLGSMVGDAQDLVRNEYANVISCLERYMASRGCRFLQLPPWRARDVALKNESSHPALRKAGLLNLGNTCYMNSVVQALFVTRQFSNHVMLKMSGVPYWARMGMLFAKMMHSYSPKLNPDEFFSVVKPPFFSRDHQHDSSEFLGYLFELLKSYENQSDVNFDYTRPPVLMSTLRSWPTFPSYSPTSDTEHNMDTSNKLNCGSTSPSAGSSGAGSSGVLKRPALDRDSVPPKKRYRSYEYYTRRNSYIDSMFAGVLLTRVECTKCRSSSLSRDVFRDLQLAFPEKQDDWQYSVQSLLEFYCSTERLSGDNRYACRDCGVLRDAERSVLIENTPKYLILVLKNFKFEPKLQVQTKLMHPVYHNHTVTLPTVRTQADHSTYVLYAAVIHEGTTLDSGHYYTLAKDNDRWYLYNDEIVSPANETHLHGLNRSSTPYILFYRRTDLEESKAPSVEELPPRLQECVLAHNKHYVDTVSKMRITHP